jgi:hypothetical protein
MDLFPLIIKHILNFKEEYDYWKNRPPAGDDSDDYEYKEEFIEDEYNFWVI